PTLHSFPTRRSSDLVRRLQSSAAKLATALAAARITISTSSRLARQESRPEQGERERDLRGPRASLSVDGSSNTRAGGRALGCREDRKSTRLNSSHVA